MIDGARVLRNAFERAGTDDAGDDDWREGFDRLVTALNRDADLTPMGEAVMADQLSKPLVNRLEVTAWHATHPELAATPIHRPLFVVGLPRTGTTLLSNLLDRDPANRSLHRWETFAAVPPPQRAGADTDPRMLVARAEMKALYAIAPGFRAIHDEPAEGPTECITVLAGAFRSVHFETLAHVPSYGAWIESCDHHGDYRHHRRVLQVLQSRWPGRWTLKSPCHLLTLDALIGTYPDAVFVQTHRDPARVVGSLADLVRVLTGLSSDADHTRAIGERWAHLVTLMVERGTAFRDRHGDTAWIDVAYPDLVADPVGTVAAIYDRLGWPFTAEVERSVAAHAAANPHGAHGTHSYSLADVGLDAAALTERFAPYRARFGVDPG